MVPGQYGRDKGKYFCVDYFHLVFAGLHPLSIEPMIEKNFFYKMSRNDFFWFENVVIFFPSNSCNKSDLIGQNSRLTFGTIYSLTDGLNWADLLVPKQVLYLNF